MQVTFTFEPKCSECGSVLEVEVFPNCPKFDRVMGVYNVNIIPCKCAGTTTNTESLAIALMKKLSDGAYHADSIDAEAELLSEVLDEWHSAKADVS